MQTLKALGLLALGLPAVGFLACGGGSSGSQPVSRGQLSLLITNDGANSELSQVNLSAHKLEIQAKDGQWMDVPLANPDQPVDFLALKGTESELAVSGVTLPAGAYQAMRLTPGPGSVKLADGLVKDLVIPTGVAQGMVFPVEVTIPANGSVNLALLLDAAHAVRPYLPGSDKFILQPTRAEVLDINKTGTLQGVLKNDAGQAIAGAVVMATYPEDASAPELYTRVVRTAVSGQDGSYIMNLIPAGFAWRAVSQPKVGSPGYGTQVAFQFTTTTQSPATWNPIFSAAAASAELTGSISTPAAANQVDEIALLQSVTATAPATDSAVCRLRTTLGSFGAPEIFRFPDVPAGTYTVRVTRTTFADDGSITRSYFSKSGVIVDPAGLNTVALGQ